MKRIERTRYNYIRRMDPAGIMSVEIPVNWTHEARQAMHETLTIEKHMHAANIYWNDIENAYCLFYIPGYDAAQTSKDVDTVTTEFTPIPRTWNGYPKQEEPTNPARTEKKEERTMKTNTTKTTNPATEKRLAAMRRNLLQIESEADAILSRGADALTTADRFRLLQLVNVAYHESGKIEGVFSVDSCAACAFCQAMIAAAQTRPLMICGSCYAAADAWKEAAWRRHKLNARILSEVLFPQEELAVLAIGALLRFNEDGDIVNETMARNYIRIGRSHPSTHCASWYKNDAAMEAGLHAEGIHTRAQLPENMRFIHSSPIIGFPVAARWFDDAVFTVFPDAETTLQAISDGARACNGKKCCDCGYTCYLFERQPEAVQIAEVLRCSKARRAVIMEAYRAERIRRGL